MPYLINAGGKNFWYNEQTGKFYTDPGMTSAVPGVSVGPNNAIMANGKPIGYYSLTGQLYDASGKEVGNVQKLGAPTVPLPEVPTTQKTTSGINWKSPLAKEALPVLQGYMHKLPQMAAEFAPALKGYYESTLKTALGPQAFQGTLNQLSSRGVLNSSIASDALANAYKATASNIMSKAFPAYMGALAQQMEVPGMISSIINPEKVTQDNLAPYLLMGSLLRY